MNTTLYPKHHTVMDRLGPNSLIYAVFDADQLFIRIDASFSESKLDKHHDLRTIISVHTQDKINKFCPLLSTAEQSVFKPFLTSRERAALSNPKSGLRELQISLPVLIVCSHTSALSPLVRSTPPQTAFYFSLSSFQCHCTRHSAPASPLTGIRALFRLRPALLTASARRCQLDGCT